MDASRRFDHLRGTQPALGAFRQSVGEVKNFSDLTLPRHVISIFTHFETYTPAALFASRVSWGRQEVRWMRRRTRDATVSAPLRTTSTSLVDFLLRRGLSEGSKICLLKFSSASDVNTRNSHLLLSTAARSKRMNHLLLQCTQRSVSVDVNTCVYSVCEN